MSFSLFGKLLGLVLGLLGIICYWEGKLMIHLEWSFFSVGVSMREAPPPAFSAIAILTRALYILSEWQLVMT